MNRTALSIQMLLLLKSRGIMKKKDIARELETNERNIREFKKELTTAGYHFTEKKGRYGGLMLDSRDLVPVQELSQEDLAALADGQNFIAAHPEYDGQKPFQTAMDKLLVTASNNVETSRRHLYRTGDTSMETVSEREHRQLLLQCIESHQQARIQYRTREDTEPSWRIIEPYEVFNFDKAWYVAAWAPNRADWRIFRISDTRMSQVQMLEQRFMPDADFNIDTLVGKKSVFKGKMQEYVVAVLPSREHLFMEYFWGAGLKVTGRKNGYILYSFWREEEFKMFEQLFALEDAVLLVRPEASRQKYLAQLDRIKAAYRSLL